MLVETWPTGVFAANCYVVATQPGAECVVIDPGQDAAPAVAEAVARHRLKPVAVLLTHGHLDHMWAVAPVAGAHQATCWIHPADRHLLTDPLAGLPPEWNDPFLWGGGWGRGEGAAALLGGNERFAEPDDVRDLADGERLDLAGLDLVVGHAPGHTPGSVVYRTDHLTDGDRLFAGDLLFAGSVGRTDLPGGDHPTLLKSLAEQVLPLPDDTVVLPGHGDPTTVGRERRGNPYLQGL